MIHVKNSKAGRSVVPGTKQMLRNGSTFVVSAPVVALVHGENSKSLTSVTVDQNHLQSSTVHVHITISIAPVSTHPELCMGCLYHRYNLCLGVSYYYVPGTVVYSISYQVLY